MNKQLCPQCKTGAEIYRLDPKNPICSYLQYHNGKNCPFFSPLDESEASDDEGV
ncbi:MAG: hypothetical protein Q4G33_03035 [bacterium]|nr:hypothetical protein [bacterium]